MHPLRRGLAKFAWLMAWRLSIACMMTLPCGCGRGGVDLAPVRGKVTVDGQPAIGAVVVFKPIAGGATSTATADAEGRYQLRFPGNRRGALLGEHQVTIQCYQKPDGSPPRLDLPSSDPNNYSLLLGQNQLVPVLPAKYSDPSATELRVEVARKGAAYDFELTTKP